MRQITRTICATIALSLLGITTITAAASEIENNVNDLRYSRFTPTKIVSLMQNDAAWGDVAYWLRWSGEEMLTARDINAGDEDEASIEVGWKDTGNQDCVGNPQGLGRVGWPEDVTLRVDTSEDDDDAVIQIVRLASLKAHQQANPNQEYLVWWRCGGGAGNSQNFKQTQHAPYFEVQFGAKWWLAPISPGPWDYASLATQRIVPPEKGQQFIPCRFCNNAIQMNAYLPWTHDWDMQQGNAQWKTNNSTITDMGNYMRINPGGGDSGWIWQDPRVTTSIPNLASIRLGNNTGMYFDNKLRCHSNNNANCRVTVYLKTDASCCWRSVAVSIPNNGNWYTWAHAALGAHADDEIINLWLRVQASSVVDMDWFWLSSDL